MPRRLLFLVLTASIWLLARPAAPRMLHLAPQNCSPTDLSDLLPKHFEPSDAVFDASTRRFTVVSDDSRILSVSVDAPSIVSVQTSTIGTEEESYDLEGITMDPNNATHLYLGSERPAAILEYSTLSRQILRKWPIPMTGLKKNKGLEALLYLPLGDGMGYLVAGMQADASLRLFRFPPETDGLELVATLRNPPGSPGSDLSALALREKDGMVYFVYDKHLRMVSVDVRGLLKNLGLIPVPETRKPVEHDISHLKQFMGGRYKLPARGVEAVAFTDEKDEKVLVGVDAPKKHGGKKALWWYQGDMFDRCFTEI